MTYLLDNRAAEAGRRFKALTGLFDAGTFRHLDELGIAEGMQCWEVGAGGPTVATWMAERVQPTGSVLATDIDVSWVDAGRAPYRVLRHDVATDDPPMVGGSGFDVVHARLVLIHVSERVEALRRMVTSLRPGGWVLVEDFDVALQPLACPDRTGPLHDLANRIRAGFRSLLVERGVDLRFGRMLPRLLRDLGCEAVGADSYAPLAIDAASRLETANVEQVRSALVAGGAATDAEIETYLDALRSGELDISTPPLVSAWGQLALTTR